MRTLTQRRAYTYDHATTALIVVRTAYSILFGRGVLPAQLLVMLVEGVNGYSMPTPRLTVRRPSLREATT